MPQLSSVLIGANGAQSFAVSSGIGATVAPVTSVFGRMGAVVLQNADVTSVLGYIPAGLLSPQFAGTPTAPTQPSSDNSPSLATTAFVKAVLTGYATTSSLSIVALGSGLTLTAGTLASTVSTVFGRTGAVVLQSADVVTALGYTPITSVSPNFTGTPTAPTPVPNDNSTNLATTAFVQAAIPIGLGITTTGAGLSLLSGTLSATVVSVFGRGGVIALLPADISTALGYTPANVASPNFTGSPTAPTPAPSDSSTNLATTAYVQQVITTPNNLTVANNIQYYGVLVASVTPTASAAGSTISNATPLSSQVTIITAGTTGSGVGFVTPVQDVEYRVVNRSANPVLVYPPALARWETQAVGAAVAVAVGGIANFILVSNLQGYAY